MKHIVGVSGGLASFEAWRRTLEEFGPEYTLPVFADVGTVWENGQIVSGEDQDLHRFLADTEKLLGQEVIRLKHDRYTDIWDAFFHQRYVTNGRIDTCSKFLKRQVIHRFEREHYPCVSVLGYSWLEKARAEEFRSRNRMCRFPLCEPPYVTNEEISAWLLERGIRPPGLYDFGFQHNNCGGMCFKAGLGQAYDLWRHAPHRYEYNERKQEQFLRTVSPHGLFLKKSGEFISLKNLRLEFEAGYVPGTSEYRSCGGSCMVPEEGETSSVSTAGN